MQEINIKKYEAFDGTRFDDYFECVEYEERKGAEEIKPAKEIMEYNGYKEELFLESLSECRMEVFKPKNAEEVKIIKTYLDLFECFNYEEVPIEIGKYLIVSWDYDHESYIAYNGIEDIIKLTTEMWNNILEKMKEEK